ncbi:hypothetical protein [Streptococcus gordonii]
MLHSVQMYKMEKRVRYDIIISYCIDIKKQLENC